MSKQIENIRIEWDGPYSLTDIGYMEEDSYKLSNAKLNNNKTETDFGLYQIYGYHPLYGSNVLLYIGKAVDQTFAKRISQENWESNSDYKNIQIYVGRLFAKKQPNSIEEWDSLIDIAEKMLIYAHGPAQNSSNILTITRDESELEKYENVRIFNYDNSRSLMPEVSGELWVKGFEDYEIFDSKKIT